MLKRLFKTSAPALATSGPSAADPRAYEASFDGHAMVAALSQQASKLGREAAEVRGAIEDTAQAGQRQLQGMQTLASQVNDVREAQNEIDAETRRSLEAVGAARQAVETVGDEVARIVESLRLVNDAAREITKIAMQTRLVAFNASVEANRAGEAGRGFGVVANAVKDLAARVEVSSKDIMGTVQRLDQRIEVLARDIQRRADPHDLLGQGAAETGAVHRALAKVEDNVTQIQGAATRSQNLCDDLASHMGDMDTETRASAQVLEATLGRTETFLKISEELLETVANAGLETPDSPYIRAVQAAAQAMSDRLGQAVAQGRVDLQTLFDEQYRPLHGTNPQQYQTSFCALADELFPDVQEPLLRLSDQVVFCVAIDRNGFIPTHNRQYNQAQRPGDVAWNTANSRHRRIFNDRAGLAAGRNQRPFLLQTYRRDMGGGLKVVMKEADAPITVHGRHWGGLRLAWKF